MKLLEGSFADSQKTGQIALPLSDESVSLIQELITSAIDGQCRFSSAQLQSLQKHQYPSLQKLQRILKGCLWHHFE